MSKFYPGKQLVFIFLLASVQLVSNAQISTFAGRRYYLGDNGLAVNAGLFAPNAIARDSAGNIYIASIKDNIVRKIDGATQVITTIAGTGVAGYSGDGGLATAAQLNFNGGGLPGVAADKNGNVYISDYFNNRIRKIDAATKIITTYAGGITGGYSGDGGPATSAKINGPAGIVADAAGNIYFADNNNSVIRRIDAVTKNITTYAGSLANGGAYSGDGGAATSAGLSYPECIALDKNGNLYISDEYNYVIRKVTAATQVITTVAGTGGSKGFAGDGGVATAAKLGNTIGVTVDYSGNIYIADKSNQRIRKVAAGTNIITTIAGTGAAGFGGDGGAASSAQIYNPAALQADAAGNVYICDANNYRVRKITVSTNIISTVAGDGNTGFTGAPDALKAQLLPRAITADASGNFYVADGGYYDVRAINTANSSYIYAGNPTPDLIYGSKGYSGNGGLASSAYYNTPVGIAIDASNNVYIADVFNNVVRKIAYATKVVSNYAGTATAGYSGDGAAATSAKLNNPYGVAVDASGNLYIADALNNVIRKVNTSQVITTVAGNGTAGSTGDGAAATAATLNNPQGVAVDASGNIFILDRGNKKIRMVTASTLKISTILNNGHVLSGVATDASGNVFVSDSTASTIIKLTAPSYTAAVVAGNGTAGYADNATNSTLGQLNYPGGLFVTGGKVYVADINNNVIRSIVPGTQVTQPLANNVISTVDSVKTCKGSIALTTLNGTVPTGGSGSYTYKWLTSTNGSTYTAISGATAQNYAVNAAITTTTYYRRLVTSGALTDSGNVLTFAVHTNPVPVIKGSGPNTFCKGYHDTLSTTVAYAAYAWNTGLTTSSIVDTVSKTINVAVTDAYGCKATSASVVIKVNALPAKPTITANPTTVTNLCAGTTAALTSSAATGILWSSGQTTQTISVATAGAYTVTVKDANGCSNTSSAKTVSYKACGATSSLSASSVTGTKATLKWKKVACSVKYTLQYAVYGTTTWVTKTVTDTTYNLTGLIKSTKYQWKVSNTCSTSPVIESAYSSVATFTTTSAATFGEDETFGGGTSTQSLTAASLLPGIQATLYPNPAPGAAVLTVNGLQGKATVMITDMQGRKMWQAEINGDKQLTLPAQNLAAGMYLVTIINKNTSKVIKLVKQ